MLKPGDIIHGKYRLLNELGAGAMGVVFAAVHLDTEKHVALKWLNPAISRLPSSAERFKLEAKATGRIHHPNVVVVHDCGEHEGQLYLAMEHLVGQTLRAHLAAAPHGRLPLEAALDILFPVLRGVAAAHAVGVLHRDLKPENIFLSASPDGLPPIPKVLDFGLAKLRSDATAINRLSVSGSVLGTFQYMAPEQLRPRGELDERADVYALGAILYESLTATCPYQADNPIDLMLQLQGLAAPLVNTHLPGLSDEISNVVARALERDPALRYANVEAFALELEPLSQQRFRGDGARAAVLRPSLDAPSKPAPLSVTQRFDVRRDALMLGSAARLNSPARPRWLQLGLGAALLFLSPAAAESPPARAERPPQPSPTHPTTNAPLPESTLMPSPPSPPEAATQLEPSAGSDWAPALSAPPPSAASSESPAQRPRETAPVRQATLPPRATPSVAPAVAPASRLDVESFGPSKSPAPAGRPTRVRGMKRNEF